MGACRGPTFVQVRPVRRVHEDHQMSKKMTRWFPVNIKPVHVGVYETNFNGYMGYSFWNGKYWSDTSSKLNMELRFKERRGMQKKKWRGFTEKQV
jgi:hypothetical protein